MPGSDGRDGSRGLLLAGSAGAGVGVGAGPGCRVARGSSAVGFVLDEQGEQRGDGQARLGGVAQDLFGLDAVGVRSSVAGV